MHEQLGWGLRDWHQVGDDPWSQRIAREIDARFTGQGPSPDATTAGHGDDGGLRRCSVGRRSFRSGDVPACSSTHISTSEKKPTKRRGRILKGNAQLAKAGTRTDDARALRACRFVIWWRWREEITSTYKQVDTLLLKTVCLQSEPGRCR
jgi:hypothetical protein